MIELGRAFSDADTVPLDRHRPPYPAMVVDRPRGVVAPILERIERTPRVARQQSVQEYVGVLGSTSTLSRATLGSRADEFSRELRSLFARRRVDRVRYGVIGNLAWGRPS